MRWVRRAFRAVAILAVLLIGLLILTVLLSRTDWFKERVRRLAVRQADRVLEGELVIGRLEGSLWDGLTLRDVQVVQDGTPVVSVSRVEVTYGLRELASDGRVIKSLHLEQPVIRAVRTPAGWNVTRLLKPRPPADPDKPRVTFALPDVSISNGQVTVEAIGVPMTRAIPRRIEGLFFEGGVSSSPTELSVDVRRLTFRAGQPDLDLRSLAGRIVSIPTGWRFQSIRTQTGESSVTLDGTMTRDRPTGPWAFDLDVDGRPLSLPEIGRFVPVVAGMQLHPDLAVNVTGTLESLALQVQIDRSEAGQARGELTFDAAGPVRRLSGSLAVTDVNLEPILRTDASRGSITGQTTFTLRFPSETAGFPVDGRFTFDGPQASAYGYDARDVKARGSIAGRRITLEDASASAYGGRATASGTIDRPARGRELALDLTGRVAGVDISRLPAALRLPRLDSSLSGTYLVKGVLSTLHTEATLETSTIEGATVAAGTTGQFNRTPGGYTFSAAGTVAGLDLQRVGGALRVQALAQPRYASDVNGTFEIRGEQRGREGLRIAATGDVTRTSVLGGRLPAMQLDAVLDDQHLDVTAKGQIAGYDLATLTGIQALTGTLTGTANARVTIPDVHQVSFDTLGVDGTFSLVQPTLLDVPFQDVTAQVTMADGVADIRTLDARGEGFVLTGQGRIGVGTDDASDFSYRLVADSLVQPAKVAALPLTGAATTDGRITGTRAMFEVNGSLSATNVAYDDTTVKAATASGTYTVRVPDWDADRLDVSSTIDARTVEVAAGQTLTTVTGTVGYVPRLVRFDATATDALRTLGGRGTIAIGERGQRIVADRLTLERNGVRWGLADGTEARVDLTSTQATIAPLRLTSGTQRLDIEGAVGLQPESPSSLRVHAEAVDLGDALVLAGQDVEADGLITLDATLGGTRERPIADATLEITHGRVRNIDIERMDGHVTFDGTLATVDVRLRKDANAVITANGVVPRTLFTRSADRGEGPHIPPTPGDRLDVAITSTPIDLALFEGLTTYVEEVTGQAQVDVRLTNSGSDPHVEGAVFLIDGGFHVPLTNVTYQDLDATLTFEEERVIISQLSIETGDGNALTVQGQLGLRRRLANVVALQMTGQDFRVIDNAFGLLDLDADLVVTGTLLAPTIEGTIGVAGGRLELDAILPRIATNTYATQAEYQGIPTDALEGPVVPNILGEEGERAKPPAGAATPPASETAAQGAPPAPGAAPIRVPDPGPDQVPDQPGATPTPVVEEPDVFGDMSLNVQVRIPDNLILRGQDIEAGGASIGDVNATLGGDFRVTKTPQQPIVLLGVVNTVRGTYSYQGRQFDIARDGQIVFRGGSEIDPRLDITAERVIQGVEARVRIQGTAQQPELSLSSNPPLDQGDILALIVFNQPMNQLGTGQQNSLAERAGGIAAGLVVSPLAQALGSTLDLDQFEVQTTDPSGRVNPAVVIGQQVSQDVFLRFRQQFGNQQVSQFLLEYRLADYLRLQGSFADGDGLTTGNRSLTQRIERYGVDLVFFFSF